MTSINDLVAPYTAAVTLNLTTVQALVDGLAKIGILWEPSVFDPEAPMETNGLYAWANPGMAVIYIGVGERANSLGLKERLLYEIDGVQGYYVHGHALAMKRLNLAEEFVTPYAGDLSFNHGIHSGWIDDVEGWSDEGRLKVKQLIEKLRSGELNIYKVAEKFCIRLSVHMGDTGVPVNSTHKSAWATNSNEESAAELVSYVLRNHS